MNQIGKEYATGIRPLINILPISVEVITKERPSFVQVLAYLRDHQTCKTCKPSPIQAMVEEYRRQKLGVKLAQNKY